MSEDIDKLNDAVRNLNQTVNDLSANLGIFAEVTVRASKGTKAEDEETTKLLNSLGSYRRNLDGLTEAEKARIEAQRKGAEADAHFKDATEKASRAIGSFASAMLNTNAKLTDMGAAVSGVGDTALALGKSLGGLYQVLGVVIKGFTMLGEASLKQTQSLLDSKDQLTKMGGAGAHTTESIRRMAREADLNSETLSRMTKPIQSMGSSIMTLGNSAGEAQKEFAQLIKATGEERAQMSRLGINQEEMMQGTADFLALQSASGRAIKNELQDREKLRRASIDYQTNLLDLAALTGKDVASLKEKQKELMLDRQVQLKNIGDQIRIEKLRAEAASETDGERKKQLEAEANQLKDTMDRRNQAFQQLAAAPDALKKGIKEAVTTGTISGENAQKLARLGMQKEVEEFQKTIREGGDVQMAAAKLQDEYVKKFGDRVEASGRQMAISGEVAKAYGADQEKDLEQIANRRGQSYQAELAAQRERNKLAQQSGQDRGTDARAVLQEGVIKTTGALDDVIAATNPLIGEFTLLKGATVAMTAAAAAATLALGAFALKSKGSELLGGAKSGGGVLDSLRGLLGGGGAKSGAGAGAAIPTVAATPAAGGAAGIVQGLGQGGGNMLESAAKGLSAFANPKVALGAAGFGTAIAAVGAGLAGATWIMGKALPSLAEGLTSFEKIDGDKLVKTGKGVAALGGGLAVFGAGGAAAGFGAIASSISEGLLGFFGGKTPFQKIEEFSKLDIDADKVKSNAEAFSAFSSAMAKVGGGTAAAGIGSAVGAVGDAITGLFKGQSSFDKLKDFAKIDLGPDGAKKIKDNAEAFGVFSEAMTKFKGVPSDGIGSSINKSVSEFFGATPPVEQMQKFAAINLGDGAAKKVKENAQAFVYFSKAMAEYKGAATGDGIGSAINKSVNEFFGIEPPVEKMQKFASINLGEDGAKKLKANAEAFGIFADAMNKYKGEATDGGVMAGINKSVNSFFEIDPPVEKMLRFSQLDLGDSGAKKVKENAQAFVYFSKAMSEYKGDATDSISGMIASSAGEFFNAEPPTEKLAKFGELKVNTESVKKNSEAFVLFSNAMSQYKGGGELKNIADNIVGGINKFFGGDSVVDKFVKFTKLDVDPEKAGKLATAFARYAKGIQVLQGGGGAGGGGGAAAAPVAAAGTVASKPGTAAAGSAAPPTAAPVAAKSSSSGGGSGGGFMSTVASALGFGGKDSGDASKTPDASSATPVAAKPAGKGGQMSEQDIKDMIIAHEGIRYEPYKDSVGLWTVGVGHLIGDGRSLPPEYNRKFSHEEVMAMFDKDYEKHKKQAQSNVPSFSKYDSMGQAAFIDLTFNMGPGWPKKFPNTIKAVAAGDTEKAARGLEDSLWYQQVKSRGPKIVSMVENSTVQARDGGLAMGPETGYPATLHGNEMIVPLDPNSILAELGKTTQSQMQTEIVDKTSKIEGMNPEVFAELANINKQMMDMMASKLDAVINRLETGNDTQGKLLKYSQA